MTEKEIVKYQQLATKESGDIVSFTENQVVMIKESIASQLTWPEFSLFIAVAKKRGLDPLLGQIHAVKRGTKVVHQVAIDGYRSVANRNGDYAGSDKPLFIMNGKKPEEAEVTVYKFVQGQRVPFVGVAYWDEYYPGDKQGHMWNKMPKTMLAKCAESQALRKAYPADLSGLYIPEEIENTSGTVIMSKAQEVLEAIQKPTVEFTNDYIEADAEPVTPEDPTQERNPNLAPLCCDKPMMISKYDDKEYGVKPWYCVHCRSKISRS